MRSSEGTYARLRAGGQGVRGTPGAFLMPVDCLKDLDVVPASLRSDSFQAGGPLLSPPWCLVPSRLGRNSRGGDECGSS